MIKIAFHADNDTNSDAEAVNAAMVSENPDLYCFVGDGPYAKSGTKWVTQQKKHFDDKKDKMIWSRGNHDEDESESKQTQKDMEAWFPEAKGVGISDCWLSSRQVGNVYVISMDSQDLRVEFEDEQFNWVKSELQKAKQLRASGQIDWIVTLFHKPWFTEKTSHSPYTAVRFLYKDIFRDAQVDFMIHGHNHNTQLWKPMIPNQSKANGEGEELFTLMPDGKTYDFSKDHGAAFIVTGHSAHEWNKISEQNPHVMHHRDSGKFGYTLIEFDGKKAKVLSKDTDKTVTFQYDVSREGGVIEPDCSDPAKCKDPQTGECRLIGPNEHKSPTDGTCQQNPPTGCQSGECKDPVSQQCRPIETDEIVDENGFCKKKPPTGGIICPRDYHFEPELNKCIPDLEPKLNPICPAGTKWNGSICEPDTTNPPCLQGECKDVITGQCRPIGSDEIKDVNGFCRPKPVTGCPDGQCKDVVTGICRAIGANEQKNPTTGLCESKPPVGCPDGQCKDPTTQQCRPIGPNEEKDANGFCKPKTQPGGDIDENGMRLLHKITGKKVDMEKGSDHRNGQRYNCNHKFKNYMVQGYFKLGKGQEKIEHKTDGPNHGGCKSLPICMWYELGYEIATGRSELQYEAPHPDNHDVPDSALDLQVEVKVQPESWIGYEIAIWDSAEGRRMEQWIDPDPFDAQGKPKNGWVKCLQATEKGQIFPKEFFPRNLDELIPKFENGFESEIRMHRGTNHDTEMKWVRVFEIIPPN